MWSLTSGSPATPGVHPGCTQPLLTWSGKGTFPVARAHKGTLAAPRAAALGPDADNPPDGQVAGLLWVSGPAEDRRCSGTLSR